MYDRTHRIPTTAEPRRTRSVDLEPATAPPSTEGTAEARDRSQTEPGARVQEPMNEHEQAWTATRAARDEWDELGLRNELLPPESFDDELARPEEYFDETSDWETPDTPRIGEQSRALEDVISGCCRGWAEPPTAKELYDAFRSERPNARELALLNTWFTEATVGQLTQGRVQQAYTDRQLVRAIHAIGLGRTEEPWAAHRIRIINSWATR